MKPDQTAFSTRLLSGPRCFRPFQRTTRITLAMLLVLSHPLWAATIIVDEVTCTLVDAITAANTDTATGGCPAGWNGDTIELTTDVTLNDNGLPVVGTGVTVEGGGFAIERDANEPPFGLFAVDGTYYDQQGNYKDASLSLDNVTLRNGTPAIHVGKSLALTNSTITTDYSTPYGTAIFIYGGSADVRNTAISGHYRGVDLYAYHHGSIELRDSTVSGNSTGIVATNGSLHATGCTVSGNDVGVEATTTVFLTNTTISGNGIGTLSWGTIGDPFPAGNVILTNSTLSGNAVGVHIDHATSPGQAQLQNTIIGNSSTSDCAGDGVLSDNGNNFAADDTCGPGFADITPDVDFCTTLANNGGPTQTHALLPWSVAIDAAGECGLDTDQRGFPRDDGACDSGAFEFQGSGDGGGAAVPASSQVGLLALLAILLTTSWAILRPKSRTRRPT